MEITVEMTEVSSKDLGNRECEELHLYGNGGLVEGLIVLRKQ